MSAEGGWRQTAADFFILSTVWRFYVKESAVHVLVVLVVTQLNLKHHSVCCQVILLQLFPFCHWWNFSLWKVENFHSYEKLRTFISRKKRDSSYTLCLRATYLNISVNIPNPQMLGWFPNGFSKPLTLCPVLLPGPNQHISEMILKNSNCIFKLCRILAGPLLIKSTTPDLIIPLGITLRTRILALLQKKTKLHARFHISLNYLSLLQWTLVLTWLQIFFVLFSS